MNIEPYMLAKKISKDTSNGTAPQGEPSAVQTKPSSSQFGFTLPTFEVSLPSFPSVDMSLPSLASVFHSAARKDAAEEERLNVLLYQAGQEAVSNTDPASKYWLQKSPVSEINQPSGRRGLDFEEADPEHDREGGKGQVRLDGVWTALACARARAREDERGR